MMKPINDKAELYRTAALLRRQLQLPEHCQSEAVLERICAQPGVRVASLAFRSPALRGMCSPGKSGEPDVILLSARLSARERGFYAAHEWVHLCCHREKINTPFRCREYGRPRQDSYLEWQANEGAAEIVMPWRQVAELVLASPPDCTSRASLIRLRLRLADAFGVSDRMAAVRLESLRYELAYALGGQPLERIELLSSAEQRRRGIRVRSLEELAENLRQRERDYYRRLRDIDI